MKAIDLANWIMSLPKKDRELPLVIPDPNGKLPLVKVYQFCVRRARYQQDLFLDNGELISTKRRRKVVQLY